MLKARHPDSPDACGRDRRKNILPPVFITTQTLAGRVGDALLYPGALCAIEAEDKVAMAQSALPLSFALFIDVLLRRCVTARPPCHD